MTDQHGQQQAAGAVPDKILARIRGLLDKAHHPNTGDAEAQTYTAAAGKLMAKYAVDQAMLDGTREHGDVQRAVIFLTVDGKARSQLLPNSFERGTLLVACALPLRCRCVAIGNPRQTRAMAIYGHRGDLQLVQLLFASVLLQSQAAVTRAARVQRMLGADLGPAWRKSYLWGYAVAVERLLRTQAEEAAQAAQAARDEAGDTSGDGVALVLASRDLAVQAAMHDDLDLDEPLPERPVHEERGDAASAIGYQDGLRTTLPGPADTHTLTAAPPTRTAIGGTPS